MALGETRADSRLRGSLNALELGDAKSINTSPDNVATTSIATVALQPRVQTSRVLLDTLGGEDHGNRTHSTTSTADGLRASTKLVVSPPGV
eukprot:CAMPEP_0183345136 /NCGR_PEP_ID=MMETSP0164_2-20130417/10641_1 /TAXON_ID=221442 /ORGANISM="Coccolithus pelagicus ssp braarudi, Strain PLY182g" /LENGTH=90 /DNA_ID=CAMNT_0025516239 /DNA_START=26 /DNA_END=295 /DNA_ORIENTATION=+